MADIELVIKIPEENYERIKFMEEMGALNNPYLQTIAYGTPLPKGHGRLGDLDALEKEIINRIKAGNLEEGYDNYSHINNMDDCVECIRYADTIIEADKVESKARFLT